MLVSDQGTVEFEGTIMGNMLKWVMEVDAGGQFFEISMEGTIEGDEITGTADFVATGAVPGPQHGSSHPPQPVSSVSG